MLLRDRSRDHYLKDIVYYALLFHAIFFLVFFFSPGGLLISKHILFSLNLVVAGIYFQVEH